MKYFLLLIIGLVFGCSEKSVKLESTILDRTKFFPNELNQYINSGGNEGDKYVIISQRDTILIGQAGVKLFIPSESFEFPNGKIATGEVKIELVEALNTADIVLNDLQTMSNGKTLQTGGMIFVSATKDGEKLNIRKNHTLSASIPIDSKNRGMKYFEGEISEKGINWTKMKELDNEIFSGRLIALPYSILNLGEVNFEVDFTAQQIGRLEKNELSNTFIATREFKKRLNDLALLTLNKYCGGCNTLTGTPDDDILDIYLSNSKGNLSKADKLVYEYILNYSKTHNYNEYKSEINHIIRVFSEYSKLDLKRPTDYEKYGLIEPITLEKINDLNVSQILKNQFKMELIERKESERRSNKEKLEIEKFSMLNSETNYIFSINKLGWNNVDCFYKDGQKSNFLVSIANEMKSNKLTLIIPDFDIYLNANLLENGKYSFTTENQKYSKLPVGETAYLFAIGIKNNESYMAIKQFKIPKEGVVNLQMERADLKAIKTKLANLN